MKKHILGECIKIAIISALLVGCEEPPVIPHEGAPEPTGVIEGTVFYVGTAPDCDSAGVPTGRIILTLFGFDNPPPPSGSATSVSNVLTAQAAELFSSADCNNTATIHRSMPFVWPNIPLSTAAGTEVAYQVRGFYDRDEDFKPFYSIHNQPTAGDVLGGAFVDPSATELRYAPITFGSVVNNPLGQVVRNITVT
ncbi:MAG: hypothetical protein VX834_05830, partial [Myxococcota bacterium]|nr:hypothetical protein [Myxococcota bacterium]